MNIERILSEEMSSELEELGKMEVGSDEYVKAVDGITKLADRIIEIDKSKADEAFREDEINLKIQQLNDEKRDRMIRNGIEVGKFVGAALIYVGAFIASTNFERENTFTTEGGKSSIRQLLKLKF